MTVTDHKTVGLQYAVTSLIFLFAGFLLMVLLRWQLAWPGQPLPAWMAWLSGEANAPGGIMLPEFYNQLVAMHGTVMIFLAVVPMLAGAFGTLLVPPLIGARGMALPKMSALAFWLYAIGGIVMIASFFVEGGAANSGWTSYPPLSILATSGQTWWLVAMALVSASATLSSIVMITTIVQGRAPGVLLRTMSFFVWAQLVTALLLLLAFPALQAAAVFQLMDRVAGSSFFLPSGLVIGGVPLQDYSGGGNPLLWQHLFWFLAHPEVYVLILPAMGIVAEVIVAHTKRPLWGYGLMVGAVLLLGLLSMLVWAHHMFLTGMGTTLSTFFQVTTMIVSVPSVVIVTSLVMSLWGGSIRFTTAMLFALAFLPMFGIGGLTGLPLGLAASDISLHDTFYVVAHFHYLVAPGTMFAIFAGIYHWYPAVTGRVLSERLGKWHFWLTLFMMNNVFMPMFFIGFAGVNRRLYDAGAQFALAAPYTALQRHMTVSAIVLGIVQIPFLLALLRARKATPHLSAPLGTFQHPSAPFSTLPSLLSVAWLTMFVGSLVSGYVLIRAGSAEWTQHAGSLVNAVAGALALAGAAMACGVTDGEASSARGRWRVGAAAALLAGLVIWLASSHATTFAGGFTPAMHLEWASWFTITGVWLLVVAVMAVIAAGTVVGDAERFAPRANGLQVMLGAMSILWFVSVFVFSRG
ncbi:MAG: cbb3-type cytochrome c oxidase subunit I [Acidobacteria bacterium]|nr:cbb3-type cytochrome c oxidase subunit I [Acidobacteriota bacterium]